MRRGPTIAYYFPTRPTLKLQGKKKSIVEQGKSSRSNWSSLTDPFPDLLHPGTPEHGPINRRTDHWEPGRIPKVKVQQSKLILPATQVVRPGERQVSPGIRGKK